MKNYLWQYLFPGVALIGCAFWMGTASNLIFALVGFLSSFVIGVTLIFEGRKRCFPGKGKDGAA